MRNFQKEDLTKLSIDARFLVEEIERCADLPDYAISDYHLRIFTKHLKGQDKQDIKKEFRLNGKAIKHRSRASFPAKR